MASNTGLVSPSRDHRRTSQHLRTADPRLGSRSPNSIPSSPTSIHSSSSAIFERDIEPMLPPSPPGPNHHTHPAHPPNPHRIPRAKGTEALEQAVPSVLDSAAAILGSLDPFDGDFSDQVSVVAPAQSAASFPGITGSGFASPIGSFRSRSPSPLGSRITSPTSVLGLHNIGLPSPPPAASAPLPGSSASASSSPRPQIQRDDTTTTITGFSSPSSLGDVDQTPSIVTPSPDQHQPQDAELQLPEPALPVGSTSTPSSPSQRVHSQAQLPHQHPTSPSTLSPTQSHPPSPLHVAKKRLSFMSYADLLSSTPASLQPLSSLTTSASSADPPPHIPGVSGLNIASALYAQGVGSGSSVASPMSGVGGGSTTPSLRSISIGLSLPLNALSLPLAGPLSSSGSISASSPNQTLGLGLGPQGGVTHAGKRDSIAMLDNLGGEWEREGLGRGMEERLEKLDLFDLGVGVEGEPVVVPVPVPVVGHVGGAESLKSHGGIGLGGVGDDIIEIGVAAEEVVAGKAASVVESGRV